MAACLHPIYLRIDRRDKSTLRQHNITRQTRFRDIRPYIQDIVPVPCNKCINCLKNKQNAMVARCLAESEHRGSFVFVTLTYDEQHLPFSQSLWRVSKSTGEYERCEGAEVVVSARSFRYYKSDDMELPNRAVDDKLKEDAEIIRATFQDILPSDKPRYLENEIKGFEDDEYVYISRLTPSCCRKDVRLWLKNARVKYEREHGFKLSPFSYVCVSEMGPNTCRPHYHLAFFGLNRLETDWLVSQWKYGFTCVKYVNRVNPDGTDGFTIASRYIGKYMSKGKFDCESIKDCSAEKSRVCQSKGIGSSLLDKVRKHMCGFDLYGEFDLDTLFCPSLGRSLNESEINQLCNEIPKRLCFDTPSGYRLPIPRVIREKVFFHERVRREYRRHFVSTSEGVKVKETSDFVSYREPTTLWSLVQNAIQEHFFEDSSRKFLAYLSRFNEGEIPNAVCEFENYEMARSSLSESVGESNYINFLTKSIF